jgi:TolB-like protein/DNA-binding winged helix-turn-helix (wHTH) protein/Flp pilus assembly protein TadD
MLTMSTRENFYRIDDLTVDCVNFRVQKGGEHVNLTPRAFDVLRLLIQKRGHVVEKQEIFDEVWKDTFVSDNALTKIIKEIRHALDDDANHPHYIETVPKRGYRLIADVSEANEDPDQSKAGVVVGIQNGLSNLEFQTSDSRREIEPGAANKWSQGFKNRFVLLTGILFIAFGFAFLYFFTGGSATNKQLTSEPIDSIAVLPFENAAQDPNAEYLSDGITESLINNLSQLSNLKVMSRGAVFRYKGKEQDAQKVGGELNVKAVLTGSVKRVGDELVITVRLDDARSDQHIWGEQYARKFADILNVQNDIAREVSTNLRLKLTTVDEQQLAKHYTESADAYQLYLRGMYEWKKHTQKDLLKAIGYFDQALESDPNFALAYVGLSDSYGVLGNNYLSPNEAFPRAKAYAEKALAIDGSLSLTHGAMGAVRLYYDWDWAEVEKELKRAQALDPNDDTAHHLYGDYLEIMGRFDEAEVERRRCLELDPLSPLYGMVAGSTLYLSRKNDEAIAQLVRTINLEPRYVPAYLYLGEVYEQKKMYAQAIETFQKGIAQSERHPSLIAALGHSYAMAGQRDKAQQLIAELRSMSKGRYISPYLFAVVYAGLGDKDQSFAWLEKALQNRSSALIWLKVEPVFDNLHDDPRFNTLLRRIGL